MTTLVTTQTTQEQIPNINIPGIAGFRPTQFGYGYEAASPLLLNNYPFSVSTAVDLLAPHNFAAGLSPYAINAPLGTGNLAAIPGITQFPFGTPIVRGIVPGTYPTHLGMGGYSISSAVPNTFLPQGQWPLVGDVHPGGYSPLSCFVATPSVLGLAQGGTNIMPGAAINQGINPLAVQSLPQPYQGGVIPSSGVPAASMVLSGFNNTPQALVPFRIYDNDDSYIVESSEAIGAFEVSVVGQELRIRHGQNEVMLRHSFTSVPLPADISKKDISAKCTDGRLVVTLPRSQDIVKGIRRVKVAYN